jgi:diguanylate cyclase
MSDISQPSEIAREALRRLAVRRIAPTPDNYRALYCEISGDASPEPFPEKSLKAVAIRLPRKTPVQARFVRQFEEAIAKRDWVAVRAALATALDEEAPEPLPWHALLKELVTQYERPLAGITTARKRDSLDHVLSSGGSDADTLFQRLKGLIQSWTNASTASGESLADVVPPLAVSAARTTSPAMTTAAGPAVPAEARPDANIVESLRGLMARLLDRGVTVLVAESPELASEAEHLAATVRSAADAGAITSLTKKVDEFTSRLQWSAEDQAEIKSALLQVLRLVVDNINELVIEDQWLHGQLAMLNDLFAPPLNVRQLHDIERRLKEVIYKQSALKKGLTEAKERLRTMLASFVDHLAGITETTGDYHAKIEKCAGRISAASDIGELSEVIEELMRETRVVQASAARSRDEMQSMKARVEEADREIVRLQSELAQTSKMARHDQLTGALNRKGLDEALELEVARSNKRGTALCLALLDVDNFKALNDRYGHQAGDDALVHLARVIREALRPSDTVARYGGEEFVVLLPETDLDDAIEVVTRLQRELTKRFFMHDNDRILITFSAGVTHVPPGEDRQAAIARADAAMYQAKRAGKNRVIATA